MSRGTLSFGIQTGPQHVEYGDLVRTWKHADELGFDSAWVFDHFIPIFSNPSGPCLEGWTALTALAVETLRLRVGTLVLSNSYRHPAVLANMGATLDIVSSGRLILGMGAGWWEEEYRAYGIPFPRAAERIQRLEEGVQVVRALWTEERASFQGRYYTLTDARCEPKPVQRPHPPIHVGGMGERLTLRVVARHADGWNTFLMPEDAYRRKLDALAAHCRDAGRDPDDIEKTLACRFVIGRDRAAVEEAAGRAASARGMSLEQMRDRALVGTPEEVADQIVRFAALGVSHFILTMPAPYDLDALTLFAREVIPRARARFAETVTE